MEKYSFLLLFVCMVSCNDNRNKKDVDTSKDLGEEATYYYEHGDYYNAISSYTKLLSLDKTKGEYYFKRAYSKAQIFDYRGSTNDYLQAIDFKYRIKDAYYNLSLNESAQMNDSLSLYYINKAYAIDSTDSGVIRQKARILERYKVDHE